MALTEKQKRFADEYLLDLNATRAYRAAYPHVRKDETAAQAGSRMLRNVKVAKYISERMQERQERTEVTQDKVIIELASIAFAKITDYISISDEILKIKDTEDLTDKQVRAIAAIKESKNGIEIKLNSKEKALELLGRHLGMWNDKVEISGLSAEQSKLSELLEQRKGRRNTS